ncbi:hypothetical protein LZ30DRAFT_692131 [Colletotrichum cereale]|nr:hypothetical protein LZ30DRAFT_692131 [Colletotrichum cereale]
MFNTAPRDQSAKTDSRKEYTYSVIRTLDQHSTALSPRHSLGFPRHYGCLVQDMHLPKTTAASALPFHPARSTGIFILPCVAAHAVGAPAGSPPPPLGQDAALLWPRSSLTHRSACVPKGPTEHEQASTPSNPLPDRQQSHGDTALLLARGCTQDQITLKVPGAHVSRVLFYFRGLDQQRAGVRTHTSPAAPTDVRPSLHPAAAHDQFARHLINQQRCRRPSKHCQDVLLSPSVCTAVEMMILGI